MRSRARAFAGVMLLAVLPASAGGGYWYSQKQESRRKAAALTNGDPDRAPALVVRYGCAGCHSVPGVRSPGGLAAQPLGDVARRQFIAGVLPNNPDNLRRWIVNPKQFDAKTAMPVTGVSDPEARHIAAYLLSLR
jgi:cytochrome c